MEKRLVKGMPTPDARPARNLRSRPMGRYPGLRFGRVAFP